jgi:hypothetical protein
MPQEEIQQCVSFFVFVILTKEESKKLGKVLVRIWTMPQKEIQQCVSFFVLD